jgi:hypothetical protein
MNLAKWLYRGGRPNWLASVANRCSAAFHMLGIAPNYLVTLEVRGRRSGRTVSLPVNGIWYRCWGRTQIGCAMRRQRVDT